ncbi:MAG: NAD(P)-dependent oxidoreductase, partial [Dehalococcoidia bacterium]
MKIGFVGTGNMGDPMALNLIKAGHQLTVHDLRREAATGLLEAGATWANSPKEASEGNEIVFTSLPGPREVEAVALGEQGILEGVATGTVYVDLSTNSPTVIRRIHLGFQERGITVLDAPVSGGVYGAADATLAVMVGGDEETYRRIKPALDAIGSNVFYCGQIGNGMVCKICNNLLSAGQANLLAESLLMGMKAGVDLKVLVDVITKSSGNSRRLEERMPRYLFKGNFEPGFAVALAAKD